MSDLEERLLFRNLQRMRHRRYGMPFAILTFLKGFMIIIKGYIRKIDIFFNTLKENLGELFVIMPFFEKHRNITRIF